MSHFILQGFGIVGQHQNNTLTPSLGVVTPPQAGDKPIGSGGESVNPCPSIPTCAPAAGATLLAMPLKEDSREFVCGWGAAFINITVTFPMNKLMFRQVNESLCSLLRLKIPLLSFSCSSICKFIHFYVLFRCCMEYPQPVPWDNWREKAWKTFTEESFLHSVKKPSQPPSCLACMTSMGNLSLTAILTCLRVGSSTCFFFFFPTLH